MVKKQNIFILFVFVFVVLYAGCKRDIVYENNGNIGIMQIDGGDKKLLTKYPPARYGKRCKHPRWSPKQNLIAFVVDDFNRQNYAIHTVDRNGSVSRITEWDVGENFSWSPDGEWIVFEKNVGGNWDIYKLEVKSKKQTSLTNNPAEDKRPRWSPYGDLIAFESNRRESDWDIWVMDIYGHSLVNQTAERDGDGDDKNAVWAPLIKSQNYDYKLIYVGRHPAVGDLRDKIYMTTARKPRDNKPFSQHYVISTWDPAWAPDASHVFYVAEGKDIYKQQISSKIAVKLASVGSRNMVYHYSQHMAVSPRLIYYGKDDSNLYSLFWTLPSRREIKLTKDEEIGNNPDLGSFAEPEDKDKEK